MKLFGTAALLATAALAQDKPFARTIEQIESEYVEVPEGYEGSFQNFNTTALVDQNKEDDLFREFEDSYAHMNSVMGRSDFTEEEKQMIRKFKLMKNMIVYLQKVPLFGKFCFYGCYCFAKGPKNLLVDAGNGKPLDGADSACRSHLNCHSCAKKDYGEEKCAVTNGYRFAAKEDDVTGIRWIECLNAEGSCKRALCECDKTLAYDLADAEAEWNILHHARWGQFDAPLNCARHQPGGRDGGLRSEPMSEVVTGCCGEFPRRYPYHLDDGFGNVKRCCNGRTFDPNRLECCGNGKTHAIGTCPDM
jgi:hypothetical protein